MVPYIVDGDAVRGIVASVNDQHRTRGRVNTVRRALLALDTDDHVVVPAGKRLWWTVNAHDHPWEVQAVQPQGRGSRLTMMLCGPPAQHRLPSVGDRVTFSVLHTSPDAYSLAPPQDPPWTHRPAAPPQVPEPIDAGDAEAPPPAVDAATLPDPGVYA
jgi:hypothetical protein